MPPQLDRDLSCERAVHAQPETAATPADVPTSLSPPRNWWNFFHIDGSTIVSGIAQQATTASMAPTARPYLKPEDAPCFGIACARSM